MPKFPAVNPIPRLTAHSQLARQMTQADVAARAGIGVNTMSNLEAGRSVAFESVIRVAKLRQTGASVAAIHAKNRANGAVGSVDRAGVLIDFDQLAKLSGNPRSINNKLTICMQYA
jgi:transcriptional regulator with XRE-family HTH domain